MKIRPRRLTGVWACLALAAFPAASAEPDLASLAPAGASAPTGLAEPVFTDLPDAQHPIFAKRPGLDPSVLKQALELYRKGDVAGGDRIRASLPDRAAHALTEWVAIRSGAALGFERLIAFVRDNPAWASSLLVRRRAEETLLSGKKPSSLVRAFFSAQRPITPSGKLALALAFKADGLDRDAAALVREIWREDTFSREFEAKILDNFPGALSQADHRFRMERFLFKENWEAAKRAAALAGSDYATLVKARIAVADRAGTKKITAALEAVPAALRTDTSYIFARAQHLRREEKATEAAKAIADLTRDPEILVDGDEWWTERRMIARKLLDDGNAKAAYDVVRAHGAETNAQRIEAEFHAGWIALRFLKEPETAGRHFAQAGAIAETPISIARCAYWRGRAAESAGAEAEAKRHFEQAAAQPIAYYGQLARARLGLDNLPLRVSPADTPRAAFDNDVPAQAARLLYRAGAPDLALPLYADLGQRLKDPAQLEVLGQIAMEHRDPRALLAIGKAAVQRGLPLDSHAFPTLGIPTFEPVGDRAVEKAMVYAIARQESAFDPRAQSGVGARGLMQLMPATAKRTAQRFGVGYDLDKLLDDPAYNAKLGSAHLGELMQDWKGSYILTFASYNAGGGNVKKWIDAYGDPRKPEVDVIDWVERIPFSETRNYVQRVMENLQVYRHRLEERSALLIESDLRRGHALR